MAMVTTKRTCDIVLKTIIVSISSVGYPGVPIDEKRTSKLKKRSKEWMPMHCILPEFVDMHEHIEKCPRCKSEYVVQTMMAHGVRFRQPIASMQKNWNN